MASPTWIKETDKSKLHKGLINILKCGAIPKHVAFIMDGNRRYATKNSLARAEGHLMGFDKLAETLEWCLDLGVREVTVYAFSIENFKRSKDEVDGLMELARQKFSRLMQEKDLIEKHGVCFRVLGNLSLLPKDIQEIIAEAVTMTKHNNRAILNVCFAYTSRDEIATAMRRLADGVDQGLIRESDISEELVEKCLYTRLSPHPDLLLRTSGEVRLSDFLLWQSAYSVLSFMPVLWPEFSIWNMYAAVLHYQRNHKNVTAALNQHQEEKDKLQNQADLDCVLEEAEQQGIKPSKGGPTKQRYTDTDIGLQEKVEKYAQERQSRINTFFTHLEDKQNEYYQKLLQDRKPQLCSI